MQCVHAKIGSAYIESHHGGVSPLRAESVRVGGDELGNRSPARNLAVGRVAVAIRYSREGERVAHRGSRGRRQRFVQRWGLRSRVTRLTRHSIDVVGSVRDAPLAEPLHARRTVHARLGPTLEAQLARRADAVHSKPARQSACANALTTRQGATWTCRE